MWCNKSVHIHVCAKLLNFNQDKTLIVNNKPVHSIWQTKIGSGQQRKMLSKLFAHGGWVTDNCIGINTIHCMIHTILIMTLNKLRLFKILPCMPTVLSFPLSATCYTNIMINIIKLHNIVSIHIMHLALLLYKTNRNILLIDGKETLMASSWCHMTAAFIVPY